MKIKRILSAFLAGAVVLGSMAIPAFADDATKYVAQLGKAKYEFVQQAVTAAADGDVITIIADINNNGAVATVANKTVAIDLNGKTVSATSNTGVFCATTGGNLTIVGSGKVIAKEKSDHYAMAVYAKGGTVNIRSGNYGQSVNGTETQYDLIYAARTGITNVNGGKFTNQTSKWTLNLNDNSGSVIKVKGGTFTDYDPANSKTEPKTVTNFVENGYASVANGDGTYSVELREEGFGKVAVLTKGLDDKGNALLVLFTGINYLDYKNAGFKVNFADEEKELPTTTVYTKVNADKEYTAEEFGGKYILGVELKLGTQYAGKSFTITPFANVINKDNEVVSAAKATTVGVYSEGNSDNTQGATP